MRATCVIIMAVLALGSTSDAGAQGEIAGRVFASDSGRPPIRGVEATIPKLQRAATSDSSGRFRFMNVPPGSYGVVLRAPGFRPESSIVTIDRDEVFSWEVVLTRTTVLPRRVVSAPENRSPAHLIEFNERRAAGFGHFIDRKQLERAEGGMRQTGDLVSLIPGVMARRGSNRIWIASGRTRRTGKCAFCPGTVDSLHPSDVAAGARPACFMDVYVDGARVFDSREPQNGLFDINSIPPEHIAGIEVYTSTAQIPAKYNRTGGDCGVVLIWTR